MISDTTLIIQGRLKKECIDFYKSNFVNCPVIISTWNDSDTSFFQDIPSNFSILMSPKPSEVGPQNCNLQIISTVLGLEKTQTKFAIKMRGDEFYSNLEEMILKLLEAQHKIFTSPVFFRHPSFMMFHVSDHLIVGTTSNLKKMFCNITYDPKLNVEVNLTRHFLSQVNPQYEHQPLQSMFENFDILDLNQHKPYHITCNCCGNPPYTNFIPESHGSMSKISQLFERDI